MTNFLKELTDELLDLEGSVWELRKYARGNPHVLDKVVAVEAEAQRIRIKVASAARGEDQG